jgi:hypothetical protein
MYFATPSEKPDGSERDGQDLDTPKEHSLIQQTDSTSLKAMTHRRGLNELNGSR